MVFLTRDACACNRTREILSGLMDRLGSLEADNGSWYDQVHSILLALIYLIMVIGSLVKLCWAVRRSWREQGGPAPVPALEQFPLQDLAQVQDLLNLENP